MLKIRKYKETDRKHWDYFVGNSNNGTIFHLRRFLNYHSENRFNDHSLIIKKKQQLKVKVFLIIEFQSIFFRT